MRVLRRRDLLMKVGLSKSQIDRLEAAGKFPRRLQLGPRAIAWVEAEVELWLEDRVARRDAERRAA